MRAAQVVTIAAMLVGCGAAATPPRYGEMSRAQKLAYMHDTVMPQMKAIFVEFDRHRYDKMTCATCHGQDGAKRGFRMPSPDLLLETEPTHTGELDKFMREKVAPEMARMLGRAPDCFSCHTPDR